MMPLSIEEPSAFPFDSLIISDLHLGSDVCQTDLLKAFLDWAVWNTRELVINGDIFDDLNFKRLKPSHLNCLKLIREISDRDDIRVIWIRGNHDGPSELVSLIVGVEVLDQFIFENGEIRLLILHGDQFDYFITRYKWLTAIGCGIFYYIQKWMPGAIARWIRRVSKRFQGNSALVQDAAVAEAKNLGCDHVTCGHTHLPLEAEVGGVRYLNTGTWTEHPPCPFIGIRGGDVRLYSWPSDGESEEQSRFESLATAGD